MKKVRFAQQPLDNVSVPELSHFTTCCCLESADSMTTYTSEVRGERLFLSFWSFKNCVLFIFGCTGSSLLHVGFL